MTPEQQAEAIRLLLALAYGVRAEHRAALELDEAEHERTKGWREVEGSEPYAQLRQAVLDKAGQLREIRKAQDQLAQEAERLLIGTGHITPRGEG